MTTACGTPELPITRNLSTGMTTRFKWIAALLILSTFTLAATAEAGNRSIRACLKTDLVEFDGTIVDAAVATEELSTLVTAVTAAGLGDALSAPGRLTVFAPTNAAFAAIPGPILDALLADPQGALTTVLTYHVSPRLFDPRRSFYRPTAKTLAGQRLSFRFTRQGPKVNNSLINCQGVRTSNGIVWIIDSVLQPQYFPAEDEAPAS